MLLGLVGVSVLFSVGHHVDHIIRGNHVGWPLIAEPTPFTYSFGFYPFILCGLFLYLRGHVGPGFWAVLASAGVLFVGPLHFGPFALEPPRDVLDPYTSPWAGYLALTWLVLFLLTLTATALYAALLWARARLHTHHDYPHA